MFHGELCIRDIPEDHNLLRECDIQFRADTISSPKITKGNNSAKNLGGVTVVNLCMSSGNTFAIFTIFCPSWLLLMAKIQSSTRT